MKVLFIVFGIIMILTGFIVPLAFAINIVVTETNIWILFAISLALFAAGAILLRKGFK